jgi:hypothetical protein
VLCRVFEYDSQLVTIATHSFRPGTVFVIRGWLLVELREGETDCGHARILPPVLDCRGTELPNS